PTERSADTDPIPGICHAQTVGTEYVDAVGLPERPDLTRVVHRDLLGNHHDLFQARVDADQLGDPVTHAGGRQVYDAGVELVPVIKPFAHIIVDGNIAGRRRQYLAAPTRRSSEHHVPARKCVADRRHLPRFAAQDIEDADPILARGDAVERTDAKIIRETFDA